MTETTLKIPSELFAIAESSRFEGAVEIPSLCVGPDDYSFAQPLTWWVDVTNTGSALLVSGKVMGKGTCGCSRCLEDVTYEFDGDIEGYFLIGAQAGFTGDDDEDVPGEDEFDVLPDDHVIDILPLITAALMINAPDQPLCKEDCAGLCPQCGANLNDGPCGCKDEPDPMNPFSVLAGLKFD
ncbi:MAG: DUF177 domain-containing protein [Eggerthellaceae bacterium]|nr:DUF177 domain-containing protein [Eggerthellaceae bacterium]